MDYARETPFDSVESAHEYLRLLSEAMLEAKQEIEEDIANIRVNAVEERRGEALRLVLFKLDKLEHHLTASRRVLNDLRSLRRLLLEERSQTSGPSTE